MKKTIAIALSLLMILGLAACGNAANQAEQPSEEGNRVEQSYAEENTAEESSAEESSAEENSAETVADDTVSMNNSSAEDEKDTEVSETQENRVLVVYFSATNTTKGVAEHIANGLNADIYEIIPEEPYTDADLNYNDNNSRSTIEMNDPGSRPAIFGSVENMKQYDIVFIGYPIWWGDAPRIVSTFVESYDFSGKTIVPFCTSGSSGIGSSAVNLEQLTSGAEWLSGQRLRGSDSQETVMEWVDSLALDLSK